MLDERQIVKDAVVFQQLFPGNLGRSMQVPQIVKKPTDSASIIGTGAVLKRQGTRQWRFLRALRIVSKVAGGHNRRRLMFTNLSQNGILGGMGHKRAGRLGFITIVITGFCTELAMPDCRWSTEKSSSFSVEAGADA